MIRRPFGRIGRPGLLGTVARTAAIAGTATMVSGGILRHQRQRDEQAAEAQAYEQAAQAQPQYQQPESGAGAPPPGAASDPVIAQLQQLADLKDRGLLTEAEMQQQKVRILQSSGH